MTFSDASWEFITDTLNLVFNINIWRLEVNLHYKIHLLRKALVKASNQKELAQNFCALNDWNPGCHYRDKKFRSHAATKLKTYLSTLSGYWFQTGGYKEISSKINRSGCCVLCFNVLNISSGDVRHTFIIFSQIPIYIFFTFLKLSEIKLSSSALACWNNITLRYFEHERFQR